MKASKEEWTESSGAASIERLSGDVIRIELRGRVDAITGERLARSLSARLKEGEKQEVFWDLYDLESYASEVRTLATSALLDNWKHVDAVKVIARSRLVKMGVAVANVALGGRIETFDTPAAFQVALRAALAPKSRRPERV